MLVALALVVGAAWQFLLLAGQQWAGNRGIGSYPGYSLYEYVQDIPPPAPTLPPYWAFRLAKPTTSSSSPFETGTIPAHLEPETTLISASANVTVTPIAGTSPNEPTATRSSNASEATFSAPPPQSSALFSALCFVGNGLLLLITSLFVVIGGYSTDLYGIYQLIIDKKPVVTTKKGQAVLPTELELSSAIVVPASWYPENVPLPASPTHASTQTQPMTASAGTQTTSTSTSATTQTTTPQLAVSTITTIIDSAPPTDEAVQRAKEAYKASLDAQYQQQFNNEWDYYSEQCDELLVSMDDEIDALKAKNQRLDTELRAKTTETARLRGELSIARQQLQQAQAQGFVVGQQQAYGSGWPNSGPQGGWRDDYSRFGGGNAGRGGGFI